MHSQPPEKLRATAFDSIAVALSPALIIGMIASLVFFLVIAFYEGTYDARLIYLLGLFTLGTVLIARIAIEHGRSYSAAFAIPLALAAILAMLRFVTISGALAPVSWLVNVGLLGLIWFLADRITFDCTLVEEDRESVQGGLLQTLGAAALNESDKEQPKSRAKSNLKRAKHNPGMWVLYFALLAFPLFGFGQLVIQDSGQRRVAFWLLVSYLGCALALLMTTSLLAMRRYLRQRNVEMPGDITGRWLATGAAILVAVLLLCMLLPLPGRSLGWISLPFKARDPAGLTGSRFGIGDDGELIELNGIPKPRADGQPGNQEAAGGQPMQGQGDGKLAPDGTPEQGKSQEAGQSEPSRAAQEKDGGERSSTTAGQRQGEQPSKSNKGPSGKSTRNDSSSAAQPNRKEPSNNADDSADSTAQPGHEKESAETQSESKSQRAANNNAPQQSSTANRLLSLMENLPDQLLKWLMIAVLATIVVLYAVTHPRDIVALWRGLFDLFALLFGSKRRAPEGATTEAAAPAQPRLVRRFSSFENPFANNLKGWQATDVVAHTFAALEAWAYEHNRPRRLDQTADEFARRLESDAPQLFKLPGVAADMLDRVMFAHWQPTLRELAPLAELWRALQAAPPSSMRSQSESAQAVGR